MEKRWIHRVRERGRTVCVEKKDGDGDGKVKVKCDFAPKRAGERWADKYASELQYSEYSGLPLEWGSDGV